MELQLLLPQHLQQVTSLSTGPRQVLLFQQMQAIHSPFQQTGPLLPTSASYPIQSPHHQIQQQAVQQAEEEPIIMALLLQSQQLPVQATRLLTGQRAALPFQQVPAIISTYQPTGHLLPTSASIPIQLSHHRTPQQAVQQAEAEHIIMELQQQLLQLRQQVTSLLTG